MTNYTKEQIKSEYLKGKSQRYSETKNNSIKQYIEDEIPLNILHREKVYCFINSYNPKCKNLKCDNIPKFENFNIGYKDYCSVSCSVICSKEKQEESRVNNIQEKIYKLSVNEIVQKLYNKEIKIQKWRDIEKLKEYKDFHSLEQLYNHLILEDNQICKHCNKPFDIDKKTKEKRKCNCTTKKDRIFLELMKEEDNELFLEKFIKNLFHVNFVNKNPLIEGEYYRRFKKLEFTDSTAENIYCLKNKIKEKQVDMKFVNMDIGYIIDYDIDYEDFDNVLESFKKKYGIDFKRTYEFLYWIKHFKGQNTEEQIKNIKEGYYTEFKKLKKVKYINVLMKHAENFNMKIITEDTFKCLACGNVYTQKTNIAKHLICRKCQPKITGYSLQEKEVFEYIKTFYNGDIIENDRSLGIELDMYIPELKIAIEYNGLYWHSSRFKDKNYHLNKTNICEENDIQLIHIFEDEWINKKEIVKSILKAKFGKTEKRIYARKCEIKEVPSKISNAFLENNHIQGKDNAPIRYGLYNNGDLVQLMTFKRSHRSKEKYMELKRSCTILNTNIVGGFSKLLKYGKNKINEDIITFGDRRYSYKENVYSKIGKFISIIPPNHFYINGTILESREKYQKHKLKDIFDNFDDNKTAIENCHDNGLFEIYDSGNWKYLL